MDSLTIFLLIIEAVFALWLLYRDGIMENSIVAAECLALMTLIFLLRARALSYQTLDYQDFLSKWVEFFRLHGGFKALCYPLGNYNVPYLYFLALFSYSATPDLYLIKLLSIFFDVVLAWTVMKLAGRFGRSPRCRMVAFFTVMLLPTVFLNGALWGQCDSIYTALGLLGIYLALEDRPLLSMICAALSFGFKLQAVFILPVYALLWMYGKFNWKHFLVFPAAYVVLVLPAVIAGKPFIDTVTLYFSQTGSIGDGLNYNSPSIFGLFDRVQNTEAASKLAIAAAFVFLLAVLAVCFLNRRRLNEGAILSAALLMVVGIPFLLPHMHDRYFFPADIFALTLAFCLPSFFAGAALTQFASLLGYHAYLKLRYLLPMGYGSAALIFVLLLGLAKLFGSLYGAYFEEDISVSATLKKGQHRKKARKKKKAY